jgi:sigma-B regulation protein RsbU (phosphoserine phosphatase)
VGLIGGLHRYTLGGISAVPCATATIAAGLLAGLVRRLNGNRFPNAFASAFLAASMEVVHMALILLIAQPYEQALGIVKVIALPMVAANALGMLAAAWIVKKRTDGRAIF